MIDLETLGRRVALAVVVLVPSLLLAAQAPAQTGAMDARWLPWLGCWQPVADAAGESAGAPVMCVVPAGSSAEVLTVEKGAVTHRERMPAPGEQRASDEDGCKGWERVQWSQDGRRLFRRSEHDCTGGYQRLATGLLAILPNGEWLSAQGVDVGGVTRVSAVRYRPVSQLSEVPAEVARALQGRSMAVDAARTGAAAPPATRDLVEASERLASDVVGAWLVERGQGFAVDAARLLELKRAGVPERVIDLMVALSYPRVFAINRASGQGELRGAELAGADDFRRRAPRRGSIWDPWGLDPYYGYGGYAPGYYGYGYGYGNAYRYGWNYGTPVVVVRDPEQGEERPRARAVNGRGYTRPRSDGGSSTSRPSGAGSRSSGGSESSGSSGSSSSSGRTAKPRGGGS